MLMFKTGKLIKKGVFWSLFLLLILPIVGLSQKPKHKLLEWKSEKITKGLIWKSIHTDQLFSSWQNINVLEIDNNRHPLSIAYSEDKLYPTSYFAKNTAAIAAVNGGFFDMREGGSVAIMKVNGMNVTLKNTTKNPEVMRASMVLDQQGQLRIEAFRPLKEVAGNPAYHTVFVTGPIIVMNGKKQSLDPKRKFNTYRHPRTCACITTDQKLLLITVDGRREIAAGLSLNELADLSLLLGCRDTINLDGGGSTTMWIAGQPHNGIVNMPSDNGKFDHYGERSVANVLLVY